MLKKKNYGRFVLSNFKTQILHFLICCLKNGHFVKKNTIMKNPITPIAAAPCEP